MHAYPLTINVNVRMISFWGKFLNFQISKFKAKLFNASKILITHCAKLLRKSYIYIYIYGMKSK